MKKPATLVCALLVVFCSCTVNNTSTTTAGNNPDKKADRVKSKRQYTDLTQMIREVPGVTVMGDGSQASIRIRSQANSINLTNSPLFVVDSTPMGHEYGSIYQSLNVNDVDSIEVLKGSDASLYGSRGANGVIIIHLKR